LASYYEAELAGSIPFHETDVVHRCRDGNTDLEFRCVLPRNLASGAIDLKPAPLVDLIETSPEGVVHVVYRDWLSLIAVVAAPSKLP
jgi:hypothetical protein